MAAKKEDLNNDTITRHDYIEGRDLKGSLPQTKNYSQLTTAEEGEFSLSQAKALSWLCNTKWSALKPYIHKQ